MTPTPTTRIHRDLNKTLWNGGAALALFALAYWMASNGNSRAPFMSYLLAGLVTIPASILLYRALLMTGVGECPSCDMYLLGISAKTNDGVLCLNCGQYVEGSNGELFLTPDDRVASHAIFKTEAPEGPVWPPGCCVCGEPTTRGVEAILVEEHDGSMGTNLAVGVASLGTLKTVKKLTHRIEVPHCDTHNDGALLLSALDPDMINPAIAFRSHGYLKKFCELNGTRPRQ